MYLFVLKLSLKEFRCYYSLCACLAFKFASVDSVYVHFTFISQLQIEVAPSDILVRSNFELNALCHPTNLHLFFVGNYGLLVAEPSFQRST
jgi:hypothetical protein